MSNLRCLLLCASLVFVFLPPFEGQQAYAQAEDGKSTTHEVYKKQFIDAYEFANQKNYVQAITEMLKINNSSPYFEQAQQKIQEWENILIAQGTSYQNEKDRHIISEARSFSEQGYLVKSIYLCKKVKPDSVSFNDAQSIISQLEQRLREMGLNYEAALNKYENEITEIQNNIDNANLNSALRLIDTVSLGSPFYDKSRELMRLIKLKIAKQAKGEKEPQPLQETNSLKLPNRTIEFSLDGRASLPFGGSMLPGVGLGVTFFPVSNIGISTAGNFLFAQNFSTFFFPLTCRYYWGDNNLLPYIGAGGFLSILSDSENKLQTPFGGLLEFGLDYRFNEHLGIGIDLNYGMNFVPSLSHTFGGGFAFKYAL